MVARAGVQPATFALGVRLWQCKLMPRHATQRCKKLCIYCVSLQSDGRRILQ